MSLSKGLLVISFLILLNAGILTACDWRPARRAVTLQSETMGTVYTVKYLSNGPKDPSSPKKIKSQLDLLLEEVNQQMSTYREDSEVSRFNKMRETGEPMPITAGFAAVTAEAVRLNKATHGASDVAVGPLINLWDFGPDKQLTYSPSAEEVKRASDVVNIDKISLSHNNSSATLVKSRPEVYLNLSSIAKGLGVGKLALYLGSLRIRDCLVEIGGGLRGKGRNTQGEPWRIGIEQLRLLRGDGAQIIVLLGNYALATSGDCRDFHTDRQGKHLSHVINPQKMESISHSLASISVMADTAMTASGLSTGLFVLGEEKALTLAEQQGLAVFLIIRTRDDYRMEMSSRFKQLIR